MKIENFWKDLGDDFDGSKLELSHEEFDVFHKVFIHLDYQSLEEMGLTQDEINIAMKFSNLY